MAQRHTPEHDVWGPDGLCDVLVQEADGGLARCREPRGRVSFDASQAALPAPQREAGHEVRNVLVGVAVGILGLAIALDWVAFVFYVARQELDPRMAVAFIFRLAVSAGFGAAALWLWRRR